MAKDPAFLFYPGDVLRDITFLTNEQRGLYLMLMCAQFETKCIPKEKLVVCLCNANEKDELTIRSLLATDENGDFYIPWMRSSQEERANFLKSRSLNGSKGGRPKTTRLASENLREDENEDAIKDDGIGGTGGKEEGDKKKAAGFQTPSQEEVTEYFIEYTKHSSWSVDRSKSEAVKFFNFYESKDWKVGKNKMKKWSAAAVGWITRDEKFKKEPEGTELGDPSTIAGFNPALHLLANYNKRIEEKDGVKTWVYQGKMVY